ncbi:MAG: Yip1 family protein [Thermodesulfobacteriota bacterium]
MNLVERVKNIILKPKQEWNVIDTEAAQTIDLYKCYVIPLAAIGPIASLIGTTLIGISLPGVGTYRVPFGSAIGQMIVVYILSLIGVYVMALIIDFLAPSFSGEKNTNQALKVAVYSSTASWLGGVFGLIPILGFISIIASLYSLYLLYLGLPVLMKSPKEKALIYTVVIVIAAIIIFVVIGLISSVFISLPTPNVLNK